MKLLITLCIALLSLTGLGAFFTADKDDGHRAEPETAAQAPENVEHRLMVYREDNERLRSALSNQLTRYESVAAELMLARKQLQARGEATSAGPAIYWLSTSTKKRHNRGCRWYQTSNGRLCTQNEGLPCNSCGG